MTAFTPWTAERKGCYILDARGHKVARVEPAYLDEKQLCQRLSLIAAAPAMYEALVDLRAVATAKGVAADNPANIKARAALAAARGEEQL